MFDFDGLILDTETPEFEVWSQVFVEHGVRLPDGYWTEVIGRGAEQEIERPPQLLERLTGRKMDVPQLIETTRARIRQRIQSENVRPGVVQLLEEASREGIGLAVASSSKHAWVDGFLQHLDLFKCFQHVVCADDVERAKPFPDLYLLACGRLAVAPSEAVALEDSPNGLAAAKAAGLFAVAVPNSVTVNLDLSAADTVIEDLSLTNLEQLRQLCVARRG